MTETRCWRRTDAPDGPSGATVRFEIHVPPARKPFLTAWACLVCFALAGATTLVATALISIPPHPVAALIALTVVAFFSFHLVGWGRIARWRLAGRETLDISRGRIAATRTACRAPSEIALERAGGATDRTTVDATVGVVGDVDRFLVRAGLWRTRRAWSLRRDEVPGLDVGSVRIATATGSVYVGLSLDRPGAEALAAEIASLPGFQPDRSHLTGRI